MSAPPSRCFLGVRVAWRGGEGSTGVAASAEDNASACFRFRSGVAGDAVGDEAAAAAPAADFRGEWLMFLVLVGSVQVCVRVVSHGFT